MSLPLGQQQVYPHKIHPLSTIILIPELSEISSVRINALIDVQKIHLDEYPL